MALLKQTWNLQSSYYCHFLFHTFTKRWRIWEKKDPQFNISWGSLKAWLNTIEQIVCIKEVFILQKHKHRLYMKHIFPNIHPTPQHRGLEVSAQPRQLHIWLHLCEQLLANVYERGPELLKTPLCSVLLFGNSTKRKTFTSILKSICSKVSEVNFIYITCILSQATSEVRSLLSESSAEEFSPDRWVTNQPFRKFLYLGS